MILAISNPEPKASFSERFCHKDTSLWLEYLAIACPNASESKNQGCHRRGGIGGRMSRINRVWSMDLEGAVTKTEGVHLKEISGV
jgi:hypothetical protein